MVTRKIKDAKDPMEVFEGKYYEQYGVTYRCARSSGVALAHLAGR